MSQVNNNYGNAQGPTTYGSTTSDLPDDPIADAAKAKMDAYLQGIQGGIPQDAQAAIADFLAKYNDPLHYNGGYASGWANNDANKDVNLQIEFAAFWGENYNQWSAAWRDERGVNAMTASFFALCGLKTFDNTSGWSSHTTDVPATSVFQSIKDKLQGGMSQDDLNSTLGDLDNAADQEKLVVTHYKVQPLLNFANKMVNLINTMVSYCQQVGLGDGNNPCYNICRQWEATNPPEGKEVIPTSWADASWSRQDLADHRNYNTMNNFGIAGNDFATQVADFLNEFNSLKL